jgi:hypothetical protein
VQVLDDDDQGTLRSGRTEQDGDSLEQHRLRVDHRVLTGQIRQQQPQRGPATSGPSQHLLPSVPLEQTPQHTEDRRVR